MTKFDPYQRWLGIPKAEQPPHFYRLLGLEPFEEDPQIIRSAADNAIAFIQQNAFGVELEQSQKLLSDIEKVATYLLSPPHKAKYDEKLREKLGLDPVEPVVPTDVPSNSVPKRAQLVTQPASESATTFSEADLPDEVTGNQPSTLMQRYRWIALGAVGVLAVTIVLFLSLSGTDSTPEHQLAQATSPTQPAPASSAALSTAQDQAAPPAKPGADPAAPVKPEPAQPNMPAKAEEFTGLFRVRTQTADQKPGAELADVTVELIYQPGIKNEGRVPLGTFKTGEQGQGILTVKLTPERQRGTFIARLTREDDSWERVLEKFPRQLEQTILVPVKLKPDFLNPAWAEQRLAETNIDQLLQDYSQFNDPAVQTVASALELSRHHLLEHPEALREQLQLRMQYHSSPALSAFRSLPVDEIRIQSVWPTINQVGSPLIRNMANTGSQVNCMVVNASGNRVYTAHSDNVIRIWEIPSGQMLQTLKGHRSSIYCLALSQDGRQLASGAADKKVMIWDLTTNQSTQTLHGHSSTVSAVAFLPDGKKLVSGSYDHSLKIWQIETGKALDTTNMHDSTILSIVISPDGQFILSANARSLIVSRADTGKKVNELRGNGSSFRKLAVSPDGKYAVSGANEPQIWDLFSGAPPLNLEVEKKTDFSCLTVAPDNKHVIAGTAERTLLVFEIATGKLKKTIYGHSNRITEVACLPDGKHFITSSDDDTLKLWNLENDAAVLPITRHNKQITSLALSRDGKRLISGGEGELKIWDTEKGTLVKETFENAYHTFDSVQFSPDESTIFAGSYARFHSWNLNTGAKTQEFKAKNNSGEVVISPDGQIGVSKTYSSPSRQYRLSFWDLNRQKLHRSLDTNSRRIYSMAISADSKQLFTGSQNELKIWNLENGDLLHTFEGPFGSIRYLELTSDGKYAVTSSIQGNPNTIQVWDLPGKKKLHTLNGHSHNVSCLTISPDNRLIASYAPDHTIRIWDLPQGTLLKTYPFDDEASDMVFGPDNRTIFVGGNSGLIHKLKIAMPGEALEVIQAAPMLAENAEGAPPNVSPQEQTELAKALDRKVKFTNSLEMHFALIPAGKFMMGSQQSADEIARQFDTSAFHFENEHPRHEVVIEKPFYMGMHEVTIEDFKQFVKMTDYKTEQQRSGRGGAGWDEASQKFRVGIADFNWFKTGWAKNDFHPVVNVSWNDAVKFCEWLSVREKAKYRLPTEAEWEYACRAGTTGRFHYGEDPEAMVQFGNIWDGTAHQKFIANYAALKGLSARDGFAFTAPVGSYQANAWSLYDMHGNVMEWCSDWIDDEYYKSFNGQPAKDPEGPQTGTARVLRSGCWSFFPPHARAASRSKLSPSSFAHNVGFRVVLELNEE